LFLQLDVDHRSLFEDAEPVKTRAILGGRSRTTGQARDESRRNEPRRKHLLQGWRCLLGPLQDLRRETLDARSCGRGWWLVVLEAEGNDVRVLERIERSCGSGGARRGARGDQGEQKEPFHY